MRPIDVRVKVKPVLAQMVHSGAYEGPCRVGKRKDLAPETERQRGRKQYEEYIQMRS